MIIEPTIVTENGVTFNSLTHTEPYYAVGHKEGNLNIELMSPDEDTPQPANSKTESLLIGFGATSWQELLDEIANQGLIIPE